MEESLCRFDALVSILAYSFCSGTLLLFNKVVLQFIPCGALVTSAQFLFCVLLLFILHMLSIVTIEDLTLTMVKKYGFYVFFFVAGVYSNMQALEIANVDVVIIFRAMTPLVVAFFEFLLMGRAFPSLQSLSSLLTIVVGTIWYVRFDSETTTDGYGWLVTYMVFISAEMLWGKKIVSDIQVNLTTSVFLTNLFAFFPMLWLGYLRNDFISVNPEWFTNEAIFLLIISSLVSAGIGYSGWWCRSIITATAYTLVGTLNKILTVLLNILVWDKHASIVGTVGLFICLGGGTFYRQAPLRERKESEKKEKEPKVEEV